MNPIRRLGQQPYLEAKNEICQRRCFSAAMLIPHQEHDVLNGDEGILTPYHSLSQLILHLSHQPNCFCKCKRKHPDKDHISRESQQKPRIAMHTRHNSPQSQCFEMCTKKSLILQNFYLTQCYMWHKNILANLRREKTLVDDAMPRWYRSSFLVVSQK